MTWTPAVDAVMPACPHAAAACPSVAGTVVSRTGLAPARLAAASPAARRPGRARLPFPAPSPRRAASA